MNQTESINADMALIQNLAHSPLEAYSAPVSTMANLSNILKAKNSKYQYSQQTREECQDWARRKGADLKPLVGKIEVLKLDAGK